MADKDQKSEEGKPYTVDDQLAHVEALNRTYALGNRAFERGDYKEAAELLQKAAKDYMREAYRREDQEGAVQWLLTELTIYRDWIGKNLKYIPHPLEGQTGEVSKSHGVDRDVVAFVKSPEWENHVAYLGSVFTEKERGRHGPVAPGVRKGLPRSSPGLPGVPGHTQRRNRADPGVVPLARSIRRSLHTPRRG